jgi:repressor LexA
MAKFLTKRQKEILAFIAECQEQRGVSPTQREIRDHFGYSSYGTVYKHLDLLEKKGYLWRDWNQKRGILLLRPMGGSEATRYRDLPFYGRIAAGQPIEAVDRNELLTVPEHLLDGSSGPHYVLEVSGDSMVEEGIYDGDYVIVQGREKAERGQMVVALLGDEATLKRFFPEGERVRLQPANSQMQPIYAPAEAVTVQGVVVGLMRQF